MRIIGFLGGGVWGKYTSLPFEVGQISTNSCFNLHTYVMYATFDNHLVSFLTNIMCW